MSKDDFQDAFRGDETHVAFGVTRATDGEVVGPMVPKAVQFGTWSSVSSIAVQPGPIDGWTIDARPMLTLNFNKYRPDLPPWQQTVEIALATREDSALGFVATHLGEAISGRLKTVHMGLSGVSWGLDDGNIISRDDIYERRNRSSTDSFRVDEVLE